MKIVNLLASPAAWSRSAYLLERATARLQAYGQDDIHTIALRDLPADALVHGEPGRPGLREALAQVARADVVVVSTPIVKGSFSGLLKSFLDLLPADGLRGKTVLAIGSARSPAYRFALDQALAPVLQSLGARRVVDTVFVSDEQLQAHVTLGYVADDIVAHSLDLSIRQVNDAVIRRELRIAVRSQPAEQPTSQLLAYALSY